MFCDAALGLLGGVMIDTAVFGLIIPDAEQGTLWQAMVGVSPRVRAADRRRRRLGGGLLVTATVRWSDHEPGAAPGP